MPNYLIVAYQTAGGRSLRDAIDKVLRQEPAARFKLLVPATRTQHLFTWTEGESNAIAQKNAELAAQRLVESGVPLSAVVVGDPDPFVAVTNELGAEPDCAGIIVSTFPPGVSRWLRFDLPRRLQKRIGLPVIHVMSEPEGPPAS